MVRVKHRQWLSRTPGGLVRAKPGWAWRLTSIEQGTRINLRGVDARKGHRMELGRDGGLVVGD